MREKLIELLAEHCAFKEKRCVGCDEGKYYRPECKTNLFGKIADHLIANGVTVTDITVGHKWVSTAEMLPEEGTLVLCWYEYFRYGKYNRMFQTYGIGYHLRDGMWGGEVSNGHKTHVLAWQYLPEPPKGE